MARGHTVGKTIGYQMDAEAARAADRNQEAQRLNPEAQTSHQRREGHSTTWTGW